MLSALNLAAALAYALAAWGGQRPRALPALWAGFALQGLALAVDLFGLGQTPAGARFGFAPALSLTVWLVLAVLLQEGRWMPLQAARRPLALLALATVLLAAQWPGQSHQAASPWAPLHWVLGLASYGLVGVALLHAALAQRAEAGLRHGGAAPATGAPLLRLERLTFQFVLAGVGVLGAALLLGLAFTPRWVWDHKAVFALLSWGVLAALSWGHWRLGWRGAQARRWLWVGALLLLLSYAGSRFVLQVLLGRSV